MLANKRGGEVLKYLPRLVQGGIAVNCQLVLCRGINDGDELRRTLTDLLELTPMVRLFGGQRWFRAVWKPRLDGMVRRLNGQGMADTPYQDRPW